MIEDPEEDYYEEYEEQSEAVKEWAGRRLVVLELNGELRQEIRLGDVMSIDSKLECVCVRGDDVLITDDRSGLHVVRFM